VLWVMVCIAKLADCCGARGACSIARCRMMLWARKCVRSYKILHVLQILAFLPVLPPSFQIPHHSVPPLPSFLHCNLGGCRRRGAGLVLDHSAGGLIGDHVPGGPCEGGRPRGWPRLSRAPARTPPVSEEPLRGAVGGETGCWR
jgi:hypothetical protein